MGNITFSNEDVDKFFNEIREIGKKIEEQKLRGFNDYNLLSTVLPEHDEVRLHSRVITSLLDISGKHYQKGIFLEIFLKQLGITNYNINKSKVFREYSNIDIYLTDGIKHIIIENKIYAGDQKNQIQRYIDKIKEENKNIFVNDLIVVYLSIDREKPSNYSLGNYKIVNDKIKNEKDEEIAIYKKMHYKTDIIKWLEESKQELQNITNLNESIQQYLDIVKKITNNYKEKVMTYKEMLLKDENLKLALEIEKDINKAKEQIQINFWKKLKEKLDAKIGEFKFVETDLEEKVIEDVISNFFKIKEKYRWHGLIKKVFDMEDYSIYFMIEVHNHPYYGFIYSENETRGNNQYDKEKFRNVFKANRSNDWLEYVDLNNNDNRPDFYSFNETALELVNESKMDEYVDNYIKDIISYIKDKTQKLKDNNFQFDELYEIKE